MVKWCKPLAPTTKNNQIRQAHPQLMSPELFLESCFQSSTKQRVWNNFLHNDYIRCGGSGVGISNLERYIKWRLHQTTSQRVGENSERDWCVCVCVGARARACVREREREREMIFFTMITFVAEEAVFNPLPSKGCETISFTMITFVAEEAVRVYIKLRTLHKVTITSDYKSESGGK